MMYWVQDELLISRQSAKGSGQKNYRIADCSLPTADFKNGIGKNS